MSYEIKLNDEVSEIKILKRDGNIMDIAVGENEYTVDIIEVEKGVYSLLIDGVSFNVELTDTGKKNMR